MAEASDLTPLEWLARLGPELVARQAQVAFWGRYYAGNQDLPAGPSQHREAYKRFQALARTNLCKLAADSCVHRTQAIGFRDVKAPSDTAVWELWQAARLDARQFGLWRKAYALGSAYAIVGTHPSKPKTPRVTIESPENVIVATDPADPSQRLAALRLWHDQYAKRWMATLYLPGWRYHWQTVREQKRRGALVTGRLSWKPQAWEQRGEPKRSTQLVPVIPFLNADEGEDGVAEFDAGIDVQNRLNLTLLNRLTSERYAAFRQTVLLNYNVEEDPVTGLPIAPWKAGVTQIATIPPSEAGDPEVKLQQLQQTDTSQMLRAVEADMRAFAAVTLTPVYYLPGDLINISADSVAALDAGHIAKVKQRHAMWGEGLEELMQLMADVAGLDRDLSSSEIVWARPEAFNPAAVADYASKLKAAGVPLPMIAEEIGWSPQRIGQLRSEMAADAARAFMATPQPQANR